MPEGDGEERPVFIDPRRDPLPAWRRTLRYQFMRSVLWILLRAWFRFRREDFARLPDAPYVVCINHPGWLDPMVVYAVWPARTRVYIYGPKETDMRVGGRNRLISWLGNAVPFDPAKSRLLTSVKRAVAVLEAGRVLVVAGEGRLTEDEDVVLPLNEGPAFFALRAGVPLVPVAINGTRWIRWGKTIRVRVGEPIMTTGLRADRANVRRLTDRLQADLGALVLGYPDQAVPGPVGRWLTDALADRPWRTEGTAAGALVDAGVEHTLGGAGAGPDELSDARPPVR
jgi:1-acyl-sn-glycerol-3-phosphate acyltransferase